MEDYIQKKWKTTSKKIKLKTNQSTKINLIGCDTIVNSPSLIIKTTWNEIQSKKSFEDAQISFKQSENMNISA